MLRLKKYIAFFSLLVLLIPTILQLEHLFEEHEHAIVCTATNEQHFHEISDLDCSQLHYQFEVFSSNITSSFNVIPQHFYSVNFNQQPQKIKVVYTSFKSSRAPPLFFS